MTVPPLKVTLSAEDAGVNALLREVVANMKTMEAQAQRSGASVKSLGTNTGLLEGHTSGASRGFRKLETGLADMARQAVGANRETAALTEGLLYLSGGGGILLGLAAGLAGLGLIYERMTSQAREQAKANLELADSFKKQADAALKAKVPLAASRADLGRVQDQREVEQARLDALESLQKTPFVRGATVDFLVEEQKKKVKQLDDDISAGQRNYYTANVAIANTARDLVIKATQEALQVQLAGIARSGEANDAAYQRGVISLSTYYATRLRLTKQTTADELAALQRELVVTKSEQPATQDARIAQQEKVATLESQIRERRIQGATAVGQVEAQQAQAERANFQSRLGYEEKILELEGDQDGAANARIASETRIYALVIAQAHGADVAAEAAKRYGDLLARQYAVQKTAQDSQRASATLDLDRAAITRDLTTGKINEFQAEQQIADLEQSRLPTLQALAAAQLAAANAAKNPEAILAAVKLNAELADIAASTDLAGKRAAEFRANLIQTGETGFADFVTTAVTEVNNLGQALVRVIQDFIRSLVQLEAQSLAGSLFRSLLGAGASVVAGVPTGAGAVSTGIGPVAGVGFRDGGPVSGPGSGTSDSILAYVSNGEYIVNARSAAKNLALLESMNNEDAPVRPRTIGMRRFAGGGLVLTGGRGGSRHEVEVGLSPDLVVREIRRYNNSPDGEADHVNLHVRTTNRRRGLR